MRDDDIKQGEVRKLIGLHYWECEPIFIFNKKIDIDFLNFISFYINPYINTHYNIIKVMIH